VGREWRARIGAGAVIGIGLLLALAATLGPPPTVAGDPGASLTVRLPNPVRAIALGLLAVSVVLLLALQRPRRPAEGELADRVYRRPSVWSSLLSLLPLVVLAAVAWYFWNQWSGGDAHPIERAVSAIAGLLDLIARTRKAPTSMPLFDFTIAGLLLLAAGAICALMVVVTLADRLEKWWAGRTPVETAPAAVEEPVDRDDLRTLPDARVAIVRAYHRFERALTTTRAPRAPWQTPAELMRTTIAQLPVPAPPVERLTRLFELARFSDRPLSLSARDTACDSLDAIVAALDESGGGRHT
jgi:hypothetical protein